MALMDRGLTLAVTITAALLAGCRGGAPAPVRTYGEPGEPVALSESSSNAFDIVALAAQDAQSLAGDLALKTDPSEQREQLVIDRVSRPLAKASAALRSPGVFRFAPKSALDHDSFREGWRILGQALEWRIRRACEAAKYDAAVSDLLDALRLGFLLGGGGTQDAALGLWIADRARQAIAPSLAAMSQAQLGKLARGTWSALEAKPLLTTTLQHEKLNGLATVDALQDALFTQKLEGFRRLLGADADEALERLGRLAPDSGERLAYFDGLAKEVEEEAAWLGGKVRLPASRREMDKAPKRSKNRAWAKISFHLIVVSRNLLAQNDRTLARTRLLAAEAEALRISKATGRAPRDLDFAPAAARQDPYVGRRLQYRAVGAEFNVYSVGANLTDEGGDTNLKFDSPDLRLERRAF